ncbi:hypothetical protein oki361_15960 [Helicobacter pylori]
MSELKLLNLNLINLFLFYDLDETNQIDIEQYDIASVKSYYNVPNLEKSFFRIVKKSLENKKEKDCIELKRTNEELDYINTEDFKKEVGFLFTPN